MISLLNRPQGGYPDQPDGGQTGRLPASRVNGNSGTAARNGATGRLRQGAAQPAALPARNTFSCLTRRPGEPWRVDSPRGPAALPRSGHAIRSTAGWQIDPPTGLAVPARRLSAAEERPVTHPETELVAPASFRFGDLALSDPVRRAVWDLGYRQPMPVQAQCVPLLLSGKDCVGQAETGTGKTAAFGIPIVERIDPQRLVVQALVLVPTRELCRQVTVELQRLGKYRGVRVLAIYGGEGMERQLRALKEGVHVVVGTPGRVLDHLWRGTLRLDQTRIVVLDEADEMLDIGFAEDIERILHYAPVERQTALFSATIPLFVRRLVQRYLTDPAWVSTVGQAESAPARIPPQIRQQYVYVAERDKLAALEELVHHEPGYERVLVFRRMKVLADRLAGTMHGKGYNARALHGGLPQGERNRVLEDFRTGRIRFLVATNVAARGLDIPDVSHVLNFDLPETPEEYVHRIGRTGRAGRQGTAISFVAEWDFDAFEAIKAHVGAALHERKLTLYGG